MIGPAEFQAIILDALEDPLGDLGYRLYHPWSILARSVEGPDRHIVFRKNLVRNHISFIGIPYVSNDSDPDACHEFTVELGRSDNNSEFYPGVYLGRWGGYLPNPHYPPLLPIPVTHLYRAQGYEWVFHSAAELRILSYGMLQRLRIPVLPWIESEMLLEACTIQKEWLVEPLQKVLDGHWTREYAYQLVSVYWPKSMAVGEDSETTLASIIIQYLRTETLILPLGMSKQAYLHYLLHCLKGQQEFVR